jgi:quercetin dioxygenase-like cupin family protein
LGETEEEIPYDPKYDEEALVYDLKPGEMVHWPLNCPHRVVNEDCLNISVTTEHWTDDIRKSFAVNYANGVLRRNFGMKELSQSIEGTSVYAKAALAVAWRKLKLDQTKKVVRMVDFTLDPQAETGIVDIPAYAK